MNGKTAAMLGVAASLAAGLAWGESVRVQTHTVEYYSGNPYAIYRQPDGRLVVGGYYELANGAFHRNLVRFHPDGTVDPSFQVALGESEETVSALAGDGTNLFLGGAFSSVNGQARAGLAKVSLADGSLDPVFTNSLNADAWYQRQVWTLALEGTNLYVGGIFTNVGGVARANLAKLHAASGAVNRDFTNGVNGWVYEVLLDGSFLYVGGQFDAAAGQPRPALAKFTTAGALDPDFTNGPQGAVGLQTRVSALAKDGASLLVGGTFTNLAGLPRTNLARVAAADGLPEPGFVCHADGSVAALAVDGSALLVGGEFGNLNGATRPFLARLNKTDATLEAGFAPEPNDRVMTLLLQGTNLFAGGQFSALAGERTVSLARLDPATGARQPDFQGGVSDVGTVFALAQQPDGKLVLGGTFQSVDGVPRNSLARLNADGSVDTNWNPDPEGIILALAADDTGVYAGGDFRIGAGAAARTNLVKLDLSSGGVLAAFSNRVEGVPMALGSAGDFLYAGGGFSAFDGAPRSGLAKLNRTTGRLDPVFTNDANGAVLAQVLAGTNWHLGGAFVEAGGQPRLFLARVDAAAGRADPAWPAADNIVFALADDGTNLFVGGGFTVIGAVTQSCLARVDLASGAVDGAFTHDPNDLVRCLAADRRGVFAGGSFTRVGATARSHVALLDKAAGAPVPWFTNAANGDALALLADGARLVAGGSFSAVDGATCAGLAVFTLTPYAPGWVVATNAAASGFEARWEGFAGVTNYRVDVATSSVFARFVEPYEDLAAGTGTSLQVAGLEPGKDYFIRVRAQNAAGVSGHSVTGLASTAMGPPAALSASAGTYVNRIALSWSAVGKAAGYEVWRNTVEDAGTATLLAQVAGATVFDDTAAGAGRRYVYWVRGTNALALGPLSAPAQGWARGPQTGGRFFNDYNGDGLADLAVFDQATGRWYILTAGGELVLWAQAWGWPGAIPVPGDYDGDGLADLAVFDGNTGYWYILNVAGSVIAWAVPWGWPGANPVSGDYDGDGASDLTVFDTTTGNWYVWSLATGLVAWAVPWGWPGAATVPGDYDGDGRNDLAVFDSATGNWYAWSLAAGLVAWAVPWGWPGAATVPGDYDGNGASDLAVFDGNTGYWYVRTLPGTVILWALPWGWPGAIPVPGDYDADGISDLAVFDGNTGYWYILRVDGQPITWAQAWGWPGADPVGGRP